MVQVRNLVMRLRSAAGVVTILDGVTLDVPPGQFASVCSLAAGHYAFTANGIGNDPGTQSGVLPSKGQIDVK